MEDTRKTIYFTEDTLEKAKYLQKHLSSSNLSNAIRTVILDYHKSVVSKQCKYKPTEKVGVSRAATLKTPSS